MAFAGCQSAAAPGVDWQGCRKRNLIISESNLKDAKLSKADLSATDLRNSNLAGADFGKANMMRATIAGSTAPNSNFEKVISFRADFSDTDFSNSNFTKSEMQRVNFNNSNLTNVNFLKSDLGRASFSGAILHANNFESANLSRIDFREAKISGEVQIKNAFLLQSNLEGVDFSGVGGMQQWQADMSCGNDETKLPDGIAKPETWPCVAEDDE